MRNILPRYLTCVLAVKDIIACCLLKLIDNLPLLQCFSFNLNERAETARVRRAAVQLYLMLETTVDGSTSEEAEIKRTAQCPDFVRATPPTCLGLELQARTSKRMLCSRQTVVRKFLRDSWPLLLTHYRFPPGHTHYHNNLATELTTDWPGRKVCRRCVRVNQPAVQQHAVTQFSTATSTIMWHTQRTLHYTSPNLAVVQNVFEHGQQVASTSPNPRESDGSILITWRITTPMQHNNTTATHLQGCLRSVGWGGVGKLVQNLRKPVR